MGSSTTNNLLKPGSGILSPHLKVIEEKAWLSGTGSSASAVDKEGKGH